MTMTADCACGGCRAALVEVAAAGRRRRGCPAQPGVRLQVNASDFCIAVCGACGTVTSLALAKGLRSQLRHIEQQQRAQQEQQ